MITIISPILTEKSTQKMTEGLYVFAVTDAATKTSVKDDLKAIHNVEALSVRIVNLPKKNVRFRGRKGVQSARRKAYVQLQKGQTVPGFETEKEAKEDSAKTEKKEKKEKGK